MTTSLQKSHISAQAESVKHTVYIFINCFVQSFFTCKQLKIIYINYSKCGSDPHLRSDVVWCSTEGARSSFSKYVLFTHAKICDLDVTIDV